MTITHMKKVIFKDGGFVVVRPETAFEMELDEDYKETKDATFAEIREYEKHQKFQTMAERFMTIIEDFNADRPDKDVRFRYDRHDILNLITMMITKKAPK